MLQESPQMLEVISLPKMTNAQAKKRLREAYIKILKVHVAHGFRSPSGGIARPIDLKDMQAIEKIITKAMSRL